MSGLGVAYAQKAYAYVTRRDGGEDQLLVFRERSDPAAGVQVPKGGIDGDETPAAAVRRELNEEAGLVHDAPVFHLASDRWRRPDGKRVARHFFHFPVEEPRDSWSHEVTGGGEDDGEVYELSWRSLPLSTELAKGMHAYVPLVIGGLPVRRTPVPESA